MSANNQTIKNNAPGAGIMSVPTLSAYNTELETQNRNKLSHWLMFMLGAPSHANPSIPVGALDISDKNLGINYVPRGRFTRFQTFPNKCLNLSQEAHEKQNEDDVDIFLIHYREAAALADEIEGAYGQRGALICGSIIGFPAEAIISIESVILPIFPDDKPGWLPRLVDDLQENGENRINESGLSAAWKALGHKMLAHMFRSGNKGLEFANNYLDEQEAEKIERTKPNGTGKSKTDKADRYYLHATGREELKLTLQGTPIQGNMYGTPGEQQVRFDGEADFNPRYHKRCLACDETIRKAARKCNKCYTDLTVYEREMQASVEGMDLTHKEYDPKLADEFTPMPEELPVPITPEQEELNAKIQALGLTPQAERKPVVLTSDEQAEIDDENMEERRAEAKRILNERKKK